MIRGIFLIIFGLIGFFVGIVCFGVQLLIGLIILAVTAITVGL